MLIIASAALVTKFWPAWIAWLCTFLVIEFTALGLRKKYPDVHDNGGTLSELVWWLTRGSAWYHRLFLIVFAGFWLDLSAHFFLGTSLFL